MRPRGIGFRRTLVDVGSCRIVLGFRLHFYYTSLSSDFQHLEEHFLILSAEAAFFRINPLPDAGSVPGRGVCCPDGRTAGGSSALRQPDGNAGLDLLRAVLRSADAAEKCGDLFLYNGGDAPRFLAASVYFVT